MYRWSIVRRQRLGRFILQPPTQVLVAGSQNGVAPLQSVDPRHITQLPVVRSQRGFVAGHTASLKHSTHRPSRSQSGVSGSKLLHTESPVQRMQMLRLVSQKKPPNTQSVS